MALEKRWERVSQALTIDGSSQGFVTVQSASGFFVKQKVSLKSNTKPSTVYEVKRVYPTQVWLGEVGTGIDRYVDVSGFTVADNAIITADEQVKPSIKPEDILQAVYQRDPAAALRSLLVDQYGNPFDSIIGPDGKRRLAVDAAVTVSGLSVDLDGVYNAITNPSPDNTGSIIHERSAVLTNAQQTKRTTGVQGSVDITDHSADVSLHDGDGNRLTSSSSGPRRALQSAILDESADPFTLSNPLPVQPSNGSSAADFNAGATGAATQRVSANITRNGNELSYGDGDSDANTLRTSSNTRDGDGNGITSTSTGIKRRLDVLNDGVYDATNNTDPANTGIVLQTRNTTASDSRQIERPTAVQGSINNTDRSIDVSLHDGDGNRITQSNPIIVSPPTKLIDSFGRPRVSSATIFYSEHFSDDAHTFDWVTRLTTGGTSTFDKPKARITLSTTTASGSSAVTQSRRYFQYIPGQAMLAIFSGVFAAPKANVEQIIGFLDDSDGLYFLVDGTTINIGIRTSTSGAPVSTLVPRASWNVDRLDGTGPSGLNIDFTFGQIFVIDFEWLGYGKIRWGIFANGTFHYCHEITNVNILSNAYMQRGSLPIRYSITNTGATASATSLQQGCVSLIGEGNANVGKITQSVSNGIVGVAAGTGAFTYPLAIRLNSNYSKSEIRPEEISLFTTSNTAIYYEVVANGTLTGGTWVQETNSIIDANRTFTNLTGGKVIHSGYLSSTTKGSLAAAVRTQYRLGFDTLNNIPDTLAIRTRTLSGNATVYATIDATEIY